MTQFLFDGPANADVTILLAHGAGGPMDTAWMTAAAQALATAGLRIVRFEFAYMASRRNGSAKRPPPRAETLKSEYTAAIDKLNATSLLVIGGKSMGGRVASMIADEAFAADRIAGLLCLGYPFHPIGKPNQPRTAHLAYMQTPALIVQGERDLFGSREEAASYQLSQSIKIFWLADGDHDLKPRKATSGLTVDDHLRAMTARVASWSRELLTRGGDKGYDL